MLILGLLLIAAGVVAIVASVATATGTVELLGTEVNALTIFFVGVGAGVAVLWGFTIAKFGTKRSLKHRREGRKLSELSEKLDRVEADRHDGDESAGNRHRDDRNTT